MNYDFKSIARSATGLKIKYKESEFYGNLPIEHATTKEFGYTPTDDMKSAFNALIPHCIFLLDLFEPKQIDTLTLTEAENLIPDVISQRLWIKGFTVTETSEYTGVAITISKTNAFGQEFEMKTPLVVIEGEGSYVFKDCLADDIQLIFQETRAYIDGKHVQGLQLSLFDSTPIDVEKPKKATKSSGSKTKGKGKNYAPETGNNYPKAPTVNYD